MEYLKILLIFGITGFLVLPFLPFDRMHFFKAHSYPKVRRRSALFNIIGLAVLSLAFAICMPMIRNFALWLGERKIIAWILDLLPAHAVYSSDLAILIFINILYCFLAVTLMTFLETGEFIFTAFFRSIKNMLQKRGKKQSRKDSRRVANPQKKTTASSTKPKIAPELLPTPEEPLEVGKITIPGKIVTAPSNKGNSDKNAQKKTKASDPAKGLKGLDLVCYRLRCLFFENVEDTWYIRPQIHYVAKHLRNFLIIIGVMYALLFALLMIPVFFPVDKMEDFLYPPLRFFLAVNYMYPVLSLGALAVVFYLLHTPTAPIEPTEAPGPLRLLQQGKVVDLDALEASLMKAYGKDYDVYSFYSDDEDVPQQERVNIDLDEDEYLSSIGEYILREGLVLNQDYLSGIQALNMGRDVLFHAPLHSAVGTYLYAALNLRIMQGERVVVVCRKKHDIPAYIRRLNEGFSRVTQTNAPLWKIVDRKGITPESSEDILVLCPEDFMDDRLFAMAEHFFSQVSIALLPDANMMVISNNYSCEIIAQRLMQYGSPALQYIFLSDYTLLNLETALMDRFLLSEAPKYCRGDYAYGDNHIFVWRAKKDGNVLLDNAARTMGLETAIANIANNYGITDPNIISGGVIYSNQVNPQWLDIYDSSRRPLGFAIVADDNYNLPGVIYAYSRYIGKKASVLHVISKQYLLRDFFYAHAPLYMTEQPLMERSYVPTFAQDKMPLLRLLGKLMLGIPVAEFIQEMKGFGIDCESTDPDCFDGISRLTTQFITMVLGEAPGNNEEHFALYRPKDRFYPPLHIRIREDEELLHALLGEGEFVRLRFRNGAGKSAFINLFRSMLAQRYLKGQYLVYDNLCYTIKSIDYERGIVDVENASSYHGYSIEYVQLRNYTLLDPKVIDDCIDETSAKKAHFKAGVQFANRKIKKTYTQAKGLYMIYSKEGFPVTSTTHGYYLVDTDGKQLQLNGSGIHIIQLNETEQEPLIRNVNGGIYLRLDLTQSADDRLTMSLAALLQEMMKTIFPDRHFCLSVCPILREPEKIYHSKDENSNLIASLYPTIEGWTKTKDNSIELLIVDDCEGGSGSTELLFDAQGVYMLNLLWMLSEYLEWQSKEDTAPYLYFGLEDQPRIFDFERLRGILKTFAEEYERESHVLVKAAPSRNCQLCGKDIIKPYLWHDNVEICQRCGTDYIPTEAEAQEILKYAMDYLTDTFAITLPDITVEVDPSLKGDVFSVLDFESLTIRIPEDLPLIPTHMQIIRQIVKIWQLTNLDIVGDPVIEGQCSLVLLQYLRYLKQFHHAHRLHRQYLKSEEMEARGYCTLLCELQSEGHENSFQYLLGKRQKSDRTSRKIQKTKRSSRITDDTSVRRFVRESLETEEEKKLYDDILKMLENREEGIDISSTGIDVSRARKLATYVIWDHPEIFWVNRHGFKLIEDNNKTLKPIYTMSEEEQERRQKEIDDAVRPFLDEITDAMGDYEVALKLYEKVIGFLDYDSIALKEQKNSSFDYSTEPDDLRNIYGAIVQHSAVCAGYAIAYQYLLQKFGLESLYVCGDCNSEGYHAWSIVKMEGDYYHVDCTWGDRSNTDPNKNGKGMTYAYFGLTDEEIRKTRSIDADPPVPPCTADSCNYFVREGLHFTKYDPAVLKEVIAEYFKDPEKDFMELRFDNQTLYRLARDFLCINGGVFEALKVAGRSPSFKYYDREDLNLLSIVLSDQT